MVFSDAVDNAVFVRSGVAFRNLGSAPLVLRGATPCFLRCAMRLWTVGRPLFDYFLQMIGENKLPSLAVTP